MYTNLHNVNTERKNVNTKRVCVGEMNSNRIQEINQEAYALLAVALDQQKHIMRQFCDYKHTRKFTDYEDKRLVKINSLANAGQCYEIRYR